MSDTHHHAGAQRDRYFHFSRALLFRFLLYVGLGLAFAAVAEHMPVGEAAKRALTRVWGPLLTASYPASGREQISVLLLDDQDLKSYGEDWPVSLGFHQRRLQELLKYQPKAVFFDIVFLDNRADADMEAFLDTVCQARRLHVPVAIGSFRQLGIESRKQAAMLARTVEVTEDGAVRTVPCLDQAYLHSKIDGVDQSVWEYELNLAPGEAGAHHGGHGAQHGEHGPAGAQGMEAGHGGGLAGVGGEHEAPRYLSPAAWLYSADHAIDEHLLEPEMAVIWGTDTHPVNLDWINSAQPVCSGSASLWSRLRLWGEERLPLCPYQRTLPLRTLKRTEGFSAAQLDEAIRGKYIVYGADLQSTGDIVVSPYHGRLAGAYLHAMALDNLLSFKGEPKRAGEFHLGAFWSSAATRFIVLAIVTISLAIVFKSACSPAQAHEHGEETSAEAGVAAAVATQGRWHQRWRAALGKRGRGAGVKLLWLAAAFVPIIVLFLISYFWLDLGPLVWIEFVLFPLALEFLEWGEKIAEGLEEFWKEVAGGAA